MSTDKRKPDQPSKTRGAAKARRDKDRPVTPLGKSIPESEGHLKRRSEWFQRRSSK
jgi:hypothetical protein